jgi:NADPH:quinone reductase-like Zn-dependent oxidoreductase
MDANTNPTEPISEAIPSTMQAIAHTRFGTPAEALVPTDAPTPEIGPDEVLIRVAAVGVAIGDWLIVSGLPYIARPMFGIRTPKKAIAGQQLAGTVVALGEAVNRFAIGDEVYGWAPGAMAEYAVAPQDTVAHAPSSVTPAEAATVPISAVTALQAVRDHGKVTDGTSVLVVGASGGVGSFAVQIAKALGGEVTGVASTDSVDFLRSIGADHVIDYRTTAVADAGRRFDVIIDIAGNTSIRDLRSVLADDGRLVIVGGSGGRLTMGFGRTVRAIALGRFVRQTLTTFIVDNTSDDLEAVASMIDAGDVTPTIEQSYPLPEAAAAVELVASRHVKGATVVTV